MRTERSAKRATRRRVRPRRRRWSSPTAPGRAAQDARRALANRQGSSMSSNGSRQAVASMESNRHRELSPVAEAAMQRYTSIFEDAGVVAAHHYPAGSPGPAGGVMHARFHLAGQPFTAMDASAGMHDFGFTEAISLLVECDSQQEIDHYWDALTEGGDPSAQQCGWLKDAYGVSWQ